MSQTKILLESGTNELEIVEFYVDEPGYRGHYGINVAKVVEIIRDQPITSMPQMRHPSVKGAFSYRNGRIVPLIDLATYLGVAPSSEGNSNDSKIIITEFNTVMTSFRVSGVNRIYRMSWTDVEAPGKFLQDLRLTSITGVVRLDNRVVFLLDLEAIVATLHPSLAIRMNEPEAAPAEEQRYHILHAEDSGSIRKLVLHLLNRSGKFDVVQATDGQEAWEMLCKFRDDAAASNQPIEHFLQGIITDIEMPNLDGLTLCRKIKEDPVLRTLPVAVFSSMINESLILKARTVGSDAEFAKPDLQNLSDRLIELIEDRKKANKA